MANPTVHKLKKNELAPLLGQKIIPQSTPELTIKRTGVNGYKMTISIDFKSHFENRGAGEVPLPVGTFAVLKEAADQPFLSVPDNAIFFSVTQNGAADDYLLNISLTGQIPGSKGNHGR